MCDGFVIGEKAAPEGCGACAYVVGALDAGVGAVCEAMRVDRAVVDANPHTLGHFRAMVGAVADAINDFDRGHAPPAKLGYP